MRIEIGEWLVEPSLNQISRPGACVRLEPKVMELLVLLAERPNLVVSKDDITRRLWPGTFVTESSIFRQVSELRRALGDDRRKPRFVQTIPKKGYRLVFQTPSAKRAVRPRVWVASTLLALVPVIVAFVSWTDGRAGKPRIALLPFRQLAIDDGTRFAEAWQTMLENKLVLVEAIDVVVASDAGRAQESGAEAGLEGTVEVDTSEDGVVIHIELVELSTNDRLWSRSYRGTFEELAALQNEIVLSIAGAMDAPVSARDRRRLSSPRHQVDARAYHDYLQAELFENRIDCASFDRAIESYSRAMHRDQAFLDVYSRLFDALVASAVLGCKAPQPLFAELEKLLVAAARHGLDRSRLELGRAALTLWRDGDVSAALAAFRAATETVATEDDTDLSRAIALVVSGRSQDGVDEARRCLEALPIDLGENWALGGVLYLTGRYEEAIDQFLTTLELYPDYRPALQLLALSYLMAGDGQRALELASRAELSEGERWNRFDAVPGYVYATTGNEERARKLLARWVTRSETEWVPKSSLALLHLGLGELEEARRWLRIAREEQDPWAVLISADPAFRSLSAGTPEVSLRVR